MKSESHLRILPDRPELNRDRQTSISREEFFFALAEAALDYIFMLDTEGIVLYVNRFAANRWGVRPDEVVGCSIQRLFPPADAERMLGNLQSVVRSGLPLHFEEWVTFPGGRQRLDTSLVPVRNNEGTMLGVQGISRDVTDRKVAEESLRLRTAALEATANAVVITGSDGVVQWTNPAFTVLTGYSLQEVEGRNLRFLKSGKHDPDFYRNLWGTILAGQVWNGEIHNRRKDGAIYTEEMTITPLRGESGEINHFVAIKQDVTHQKLLQEEFLQAQKLEALGRFTAGIAHDFNNLLTSIIGFSEIVLQSMSENHPLHREVNVIKKAGERAASLTRQLLVFSRKQLVEPRVLDLDEVTRDMERILHRVIGEDIRLTIRSSPAPAYVLADRSQMEQVLMNLAVNARDAMPHGGELTIETNHIDDPVDAPDSPAPGERGPFVVLSVRDTGNGMNPEIQKRAFEPFFTTKEVGKGTGLGLSTVYGIVKQSRGHIRLESHEGSGTVISIILPFVNGPTPADPDEAEEKPSATSSDHVLLVEDDPLVRRLVSRILKANGYQVLVAETAEAACRAFERDPERFRLLVTDVVMPGMTGMELSLRLARIQPNLKVLFMSGYPDEVIAEQGGIPDGFYLIPKPFTATSFATKLHRVAVAGQALGQVIRPESR